MLKGVTYGGQKSIHDNNTLLGCNVNLVLPSSFSKGSPPRPALRFPLPLGPTESCNGGNDLRSAWCSQFQRQHWSDTTSATAHCSPTLNHFYSLTLLCCYFRSQSSSPASYFRTPFLLGEKRLSGSAVIVIGLQIRPTSRSESVSFSCRFQQTRVVTSPHWSLSHTF